MKNAALTLASLGSFVLTLVVFMDEVKAANCTTDCVNSNQCFGTNQVCAPCNSTGGFGSCGVQYTYWNAPVIVVGGGAQTTSTAKANCYLFANCTVGAPAGFTGCGAAGCGGWSLSSCYSCALGVMTPATYDACTPTGCGEG